jgi:hypothetical protein
MLFKKATDKKILKAFRTEWPDMKGAIYSPNGRVLLSRGKAEAKDYLIRLEAKAALSPAQYVQVNIYFIAMACLEFLSYNSCLRKDKKMLMYTQEQCVSMEGRIKSAILTKKLPPMLGPPLTEKATLIAIVSKDAQTLVDGYSDTERLWHSLVVRAKSSLAGGTPRAARC